ncbi:MAG TPA: CcmD family protein [Bacteroidota bacterium]|nr:CcmD family protein [Bacteroidota bacterium]
MLDFLGQQPLYVVLLVVLIIWLGLYFYLFRLDSRVKKLEGRKP